LSGTKASLSKQLVGWRASWMSFCLSTVVVMVESCWKKRFTQRACKGDAICLPGGFMAANGWQGIQGAAH